MSFPKSIPITVYLLILLTGALSLINSGYLSAAENQVHVIQLSDDTINPVTAEYIIKAIDEAHRDSAQCLIIKMDTPGGLLNSTRMIVKAMLTSDVPIVVYIAPSGSRAGSAGVFITYASHIAVMAPSTNIGAAHPVQMGMKAPRKPGDWDELRELIDELRESKKNGSKEKKPADEATEEKPLEADVDPMSSKILQDTVAFVKAIANERGRNVDWAVQSVVKSESITSEEALEKGVIDFIAKSDNELLDQLDGRTVSVDGNEVVLRTKNAVIKTVEMDVSQKFFNVLANPNIAYFLMILGFYGLLFEVTHPGFGVPGILGIVFLILAFYSMQTLPTNYAGLALMTLGVVLFIAELYTPTFGILTLGGLVCLVLGSMLLFESVDPIMRVSRSMIWSFSLTTAAITLFLLQSVLRSQRAKIKGGQEGLIGETAEVLRAIKPNGRGKVFVHGEIWNAFSSDFIKKGEEVIVSEVKGLTLKVDRTQKEV